MDSYEKLIYENLDKGTQYKLTASEFRDVEYVHLRKYYLNFEGEWVPSKEGAAIPATIANMYALLDGVIELCAHEESIRSLEAHIRSKISDLKNANQSVTIDS